MTEQPSFAPADRTPLPSTTPAGAPTFVADGEAAPRHELDGRLRDADGWLRDADGRLYRVDSDG